MRHDPTVLEQVVQHVPWGVFDRLVAEHGADAGVRGFDSRNHFLALLAAALGGHHGLRPTVAALAPHRGALRLMGGKPPARSTLSEAGARRPAALFMYDFGWFAKLAAADCHFVTRLKVNTPLREIEERKLPPAVTREGEGVVLADRFGRLPARLAASRRNPFDQRAREVVVRITTGKILRLFTNDLTSPAETIAALYKERWQIELFFKWIKQNLRISRFIGTSENAVRAQIAVAMIAYLLLRFIHEQQKFALPDSIFLLVIRCHLFTRRPCNELLNPPPKAKQPPNPQLNLFIGKSYAGQ